MGQMTAITIITTTITPMSEADLLRLTHWLSPVFPVGSYAYWGGLETAIADGHVTSEATLQSWLDGMLTLGSGRADAILLANALNPESDPALLADWSRALASSAERWQETWEQGQAFQRALEATGEGDRTPMPLPVALGVAARPLTLPDEQVIALFLQALVANLVTGAVRHIPLGQGEGTRVIAALGPTILETARAACALHPEDATTATFGADLAQMRHETQDIRIFRT